MHNIFSMTYFVQAKGVPREYPLPPRNTGIATVSVFRNSMSKLVEFELHLHIQSDPKAMTSSCGRLQCKRNDNVIPIFHFISFFVIRE